MPPRPCHLGPRHWAKPTVPMPPCQASRPSKRPTPPHQAIDWPCGANATVHAATFERCAHLLRTCHVLPCHSTEPHSDATVPMAPPSHANATNRGHHTTPRASVPPRRCHRARTASPVDYHVRHGRPGRCRGVGRLLGCVLGTVGWRWLAWHSTVARPGGMGAVAWARWHGRTVACAGGLARWHGPGILGRYLGPVYDNHGTTPGVRPNRWRTAGEASAPGPWPGCCPRWTGVQVKASSKDNSVDDIRETMGPRFRVRSYDHV